jgi:hypothetical protein
MGIKAIDEINNRIKDALLDLQNGKLDSEVIHLKGKNVDAVLYTVKKASNDLMFLSESLERKGYGDKSLLGKLKQAFEGLFGGF